MALRAASRATSPPPTTITLLADAHRPAEVQVAQELDGALHAAPAGRRAGRRRAALQAGGQEDGLVAVAQQAVHREVGAGALVEPQVHAQRRDLVDLALQDVLGQAVVGDADAQHAAGHRQRLEDGGRVAELGQVAGAGQAGGAGADDGDLLLLGHRRGLHLHARPDGVGHVALQGRQGDWVVDLVARAADLAEAGADAAADGGERVGLFGHAVGVLEAALGDQSDVAVRRGVHGAGRLARAPALLVDGEGGRHGVAERARDGGALGDAEVEGVVVLHRAGRGALAAADAGLADVARPVAELHAELARAGR